jgi:hypothetical protein
MWRPPCCSMLYGGCCALQRVQPMLQHVSLCSGHHLAGLASYRMRDHGQRVLVSIAVLCCPFTRCDRCMLCATSTHTLAREEQVAVSLVRPQRLDTSSSEHAQCPQQVLDAARCRVSSLLRRSAIHRYYGVAAAGAAGGRNQPYRLLICSGYVREYLVEASPQPPSSAPPQHRPATPNQACFDQRCGVRWQQVACTAPVAASASPMS